jgi:hypothetical protein
MGLDFSIYVFKRFVKTGGCCGFTRRSCGFSRTYKV